MEEHKWLYLHSFLSRNTKYKLEHYLKAMSECEDEARSCYYDDVNQHLQVGNEFLKMMVLDACFIIEATSLIDDRQAAANSMMKSAASLKMDDDIIEIEEEANTSTNASPRPSCLTPDRQALTDSIMESITASVSKFRRGDPPTIYKVPRTIRQVNKVAYSPQIVSIGPYHNGKKKLKAMEEHKWLYLHSFLSRNTKYKLEHYLKAMSEWEDEARSCYYDDVNQHLQVGNEFLKMMVLDACFIIELILRFHQRMKFFLRQQWEELKQKEEDLVLISAMEEFFFHSNGFEDPTLDKVGMTYYIRYDMLLLENHIPFFVLQRIFKMACPVNVPVLEKLARDFFVEVMPMKEKIKINDSYYHLLHLFHSHLILTDSEEEPNLLCNPTINYVLNKLKNLLPCSNESQLPITETREMIPCATDLQLAGVKFKKNEKSNNISNVKFSHGVLEITPLVIHDQSDTLFRNLLAFEQCCLQAKFHFFATYIQFMDFFVNTSKDVALLHHNGIIDNLLGSDDDVARLFNKLCIRIFQKFEIRYLRYVKYNVQKHYENKWYMWRASLTRNYFSNPWSVISLFAASILLLLTITQTFYTIFPYYRPRS